MFRDDLLKDKVILVTGGGSGLGQSMAKRFGELGAKLVLAGRRPDPLEETATAIREASPGAEVLTHPCDIRNPDQVDAMVATAVEKLGRVDHLVNNAAGNFLAQAEGLSAKGFDAVVRIVLHGTFHCTNAVGKHMIERGGGGSILSIVTTYAWTGSAFVLPSACAKAGVLAMTRSLAVEWGRYDIRCNAIAPGPFPTEGAWSALMPDPSMEEQHKKRIPSRRFGEHIELTNLASYLLAEESGYVNGECVTIDGGEWLMGGEFNHLTAMPSNVIDGVFGMMKARRDASRAKRRGEGESG